MTQYVRIPDFERMYIITKFKMFKNLGLYKIYAISIENYMTSIRKWVYKYITGTGMVNYKYTLSAIK